MIANVTNPPAHSANEQMLFTVAEVAEQLRCSQALVYALVSKGRLAGFRIGVGRGGIRISDADIQAYLASVRVNANEEVSVTKPPRRQLKHLKLS